MDKVPKDMGGGEDGGRHMQMARWRRKKYIDESMLNLKRTLEILLLTLFIFQSLWSPIGDEVKVIGLVYVLRVRRKEVRLGAQEELKTFVVRNVKGS